MHASAGGLVASLGCSWISQGAVAAAAQRAHQAATADGHSQVSLVNSKGFVTTTQSKAADRFYSTPKQA
jgi:hypothetical protein